MENIRPASATDLEAITRIYNYYIEHTAITFDISPYAPKDREAWFTRHQPGSRYQLWTLTLQDKVAGYACSGPLRSKAAYDTSVETSIYLAQQAIGQGLGRALYQHLLDSLKHSADPIHRCYGIITQPNDASMALHHRLGFKEVGRLSEVGFKFDRYWDTIWMELAL